MDLEVETGDLEGDGAVEEIGEPLEIVLGADDPVEVDCAGRRGWFFVVVVVTAGGGRRGVGWREEMFAATDSAGARARVRRGKSSGREEVAVGAGQGSVEFELGGGRIVFFVNGRGRIRTATICN